MDRPNMVTVFETDNYDEVKLLKSKLEENSIIGVIEEDTKDSLGIPLESTVLKLKVHLKDEFKAFEIIDQYWQDTE